MRWLFLASLLLLLPFVSADLLSCDSEQYKGILCEASEGVYRAYLNHLNEVKESKSNCGKQPQLPHPPGCVGEWVQYKCPFDEPARNLIFEIADICSEKAPTPPEVTTPAETPTPPTVTPPKPVAAPPETAERKHCCFCLVKKGMERESLPISIVYTPEQCQQSCQKYGFLNNLEIIKHIARVGLCPALSPMPVSAPKEEKKEEIKETPCKDCRSLYALANSKTAELMAKSVKLREQLENIQRYIDELKEEIGLRGPGFAEFKNLYAKLESAKLMEAEVKRHLEEIKKELDAITDELMACVESPLPPCPGLGEDGLEAPPTPGSPGKTVERPKFISEAPSECYDSDAFSAWPPEVEGFVRVSKPGNPVQVFKDSCTVQTITTVLGDKLPFSATVTEWFCRGKNAASMEIICNSAECNKKGTACGYSLTKAPPICGNREVEKDEECDPPGMSCGASTADYYFKGVCKSDCKCEWTEKTPRTPKPSEPTEPKGPPPVMRWDDEEEEEAEEPIGVLPCKDCRIFKMRLDSQKSKASELSAQLDDIQKYIKTLERDIAISGEVKAAVTNLYAQLEDAKRKEAQIKSQLEELQIKIVQALAKELMDCMNDPLPPCPGLSEDGLEYPSTKEKSWLEKILDSLFG